MNDSALLTSDQIIVAVDVASAAEALRLAERLHGTAQWLKVGLELFTREGPRLVQDLRSIGWKIFLDLKLHDIPNTVARAAAAASALDVNLLTLHATGGAAMIRAARQAVEGSNTKLLAVTVLTSLDDSDLKALGYGENSSPLALRFGALAAQNGAHGLVCSVHEAAVLRAKVGPEQIIVTPGIRHASADVGDQKRISTPQAAIAAGANYLVVGRPITEAPDPLVAFQDLLK